VSEKILGGDEGTDEEGVPEGRCVEGVRRH